MPIPALNIKMVEVGNIYDYFEIDSRGGFDNLITCKLCNTNIKSKKIIKWSFYIMVDHLKEYHPEILVAEEL